MCIGCIRCLSIVFVPGSDECSKTVCTSLESIGEKIQDKVVAVSLIQSLITESMSNLIFPQIKLESESENGKHFSQIFPVLIVPSTFVIKNGVPLEIIPKSVNPDEFVAKIESAWSKEAVQRSAAPTSEAAASTPTMSPDEKVVLAQQKLAELKAKKAKEEEELERQREASRRETGKAVLHAQKTREEAEMAALMEERRRDKLLEKQAREKVLADIARDREEKKRRLEQGNKAPVVQTPLPQPVVVGDSARIQFRFPDGHTANRQFKSSETLSAARIFVNEHASLNNFTLSTTYPRRVFTDAESETSLQDLGLVPSAVLMVIPKSDRS